MIGRIWKAFIATIAMALLTSHAMAEMGTLDITIYGGPGSGQDQFARAVSDTLREEGLADGAQINSVLGAGGIAALVRFIQNGPMDGNSLYTLGAGTLVFMAINKTEVTMADVQPLVRLSGDYPVLVTAADSDIKTLDDLTKKLRADPGSVPHGGSDFGTIDHIFFARYADQIGVDVKRINHIPHANTGEVAISVLSHQVAVGTGTPQDFAGQVAAGKLRYLAIAAPERVPGVDAPTFKELGVDLVMPVSRGFFAHKDITAEQKEALEDMFAKLAKSDRWQQVLKERNWPDQYLNAAGYGAYVNEFSASLTTILQKLGFNQK